MTEQNQRFPAHKSEVEQDVRSVIRRLPTLTAPVRIELVKLDEPFGEIILECRKRKIQVNRNGPGDWTFVPPPEKRSSAVIVACRAVCLLFLAVAVVFSSPFTTFWSHLENRLKEDSLFTNLLASVVFTGFLALIGHRYIQRFFKAFLGLGEERNDVL